LPWTVHIQRHTPILSAWLWDELVEVLEERFDRLVYELPALGLYRRLAERVEPAELPTPVCRHPDDDRVLATALAGRADAIVTGDDDLLVLGAYEGIAILSPRRFLERQSRA
jgi:putative PIN family toxin of toxin-antitoxin system